MADKGTIYLNSPPSQLRQSSNVVKDNIKLDKLVREKNIVIYELSSAFPFQLFPDKIIIDENKVSIVRKELFFKRIFPIMIDDILTVKINRSILFASLEFDIKRYEENPSPTTYLWPKEASLAKRYIFGLVQAKRENIDLSALSTKQLKRKLLEIGRASDEADTLF